MIVNILLGFSSKSVYVFVLSVMTAFINTTYCNTKYQKCQ